MKGRVLKFEELKVGMKVCNEEGEAVTVKECDDIHNVYVKSRRVSALHCLVEGCTETIELEGYEPFESPQYDPLFKYIRERKK